LAMKDIQHGINTAGRLYSSHENETNVFLISTSFHFHLYQYASHFSLFKHTPLFHAAI
jgi:hypothetical protein